ncbi:hypothetical protein IWW34DRAFT_176467 [Fusarium oxysporum f. sp. albedinis]|nr:hypothetical protein IWW34DRAFT_176467 [Fusarium oxysporum f. sp. albedinis]
MGPEHGSRLFCTWLVCHLVATAAGILRFFAHTKDMIWALFNCGLFCEIEKAHDVRGLFLFEVSWLKIVFDCCAAACIQQTGIYYNLQDRWSRSKFSS